MTTYKPRYQTHTAYPSVIKNIPLEAAKLIDYSSGIKQADRAMEAIRREKRAQRFYQLTMLAILLALGAAAFITGILHPDRQNQGYMVS